MRCEEIIFTNNAHSSATASSNCCIPNSNANNDEHDPPIEIAVNGRVPDNYDRIATGGAVAVNNLPDSIVFRRSSIIGLNGNHLPSNNKGKSVTLEKGLNVPYYAKTINHRYTLVHQRNEK